MLLHGKRGYITKTLNPTGRYDADARPRFGLAPEVIRPRPFVFYSTAQWRS